LKTDNYQNFQSLVGAVSEKEFKNISKNVDMYIAPDVAIFIPYLDYCDYAITPDHKHPSYSFIYNYSGVGEVMVSKEIKKSPFGNKPNICVFSPDVPHQEVIQEQFKSYMAVCVSKKFYEKETRNYPDISLKKFTGDYFPGNELILNTLKRFIIEFDEKLPCRAKLLQAISLEITHLLIRHCNNIKNQETKISQKMEINQLINYLNENYAKKITVEEMAKFVNLSPSHFARVFKEETGYSPVDFLMNLKVQKAKRFLISKQHNITEIAYSCGFSSASHFTNRFIERIGISPSNFRKKQLSM
jgi:AraC-like DNA-binding protein